MAIEPIPTSIRLSALGQTVVAGVKVATPDLLNEVNRNAMQNVDFSLYSDQLSLESIAGRELISIARDDIIGGNISNRGVISNIDSINSTYSPTKIFTAPDGINSFFGNFAKKLISYLPETEDTESGDVVYLDSSGNIVVEVSPLASKEIVDIQLVTFGSVENDIMNQVEES